MKYDVDFFISKFEAIPEDMWGVGAYRSSSDKYCALGFCGANAKNDLIGCDEGLALWELTHRVINKYVPDINDGDDADYPQPTPKQRILAALNDVKRLQQPKEEKPLISTTQQFKEITFEKIKEQNNISLSVNYVYMFKVVCIDDSGQSGFPSRPNIKKGNIYTVFNERIVSQDIIKDGFRWRKGIYYYLVECGSGVSYVATAFIKINEEQQDEKEFIREYKTETV